jgi:hypothetical protein
MVELMTARLPDLVNAMTRCWKEEGHQTSGGLSHALKDGCAFLR